MGRYKWDWEYINTLDLNDIDEAYGKYSCHLREMGWQEISSKYFREMLKRKGLYSSPKKNFKQKDDDFIKLLYPQIGARESWLVYIQNFTYCSYDVYANHARYLGVESPRKKEGEISVQIRNGKPYSFIRRNGKLTRLDRLLLNVEDSNIYVFHLNNDSLDNSIENLYAIHKKPFVRINHLLTDNPDYNKTLLMLAELEYELNERSKHDRTGKVREA